VQSRIGVLGWEWGSNGSGVFSMIDDKWLALEGFFQKLFTGQGGYPMRWAGLVSVCVWGQLPLVNGICLLTLDRKGGCFAAIEATCDEV